MPASHASGSSMPISLRKAKSQSTSISFGLCRVAKPPGPANRAVTNLMQLTVDTSYWTRYRSRTKKPDLDPRFKFPQAIPGLFAGRFPAIPRTDADLDPHDHIQAIANTAGFHFGYIEQGGSSLYQRWLRR